MSLDVHLEEEPCKCCGKSGEGYWANITHNLTGMADAAGIYGIVWHPEENGITHAKQLIEPLRKAIADMEDNPAKYKKHNAKNGWGLYENFLPWLKDYLYACERMPKAKVRVSR